ncbi:hypothetical protein Pcinc_027229 [Petrolisthes cinctipes]|uniref:C3H1-type domain-containing protein n=1 Tax=Petrolisthes cinctipes TaxID=88211 RepID=A0AAE1K8X9_PETCI|nr:hypothetical protein Pcinc_027229 [Petrolisthes cinctipes]
MVKRYYCDFCDKSFPYSVEGRKKHYNGFQHQQQRTAHYDTFKSARERLEEEKKREKCRIFHSGKECWFGEACKYSHHTPVTLASLEQQAWQEEKEQRIAQLPSQMQGESEPTLESWLRGCGEKETSATNHNTEDQLRLWQMTPEASATLQSLLQHLPPSLTPPQPSDDWLTYEYPDWG